MKGARDGGRNVLVPGTVFVDRLPIRSGQKISLDYKLSQTSAEVVRLPDYSAP